jgi:hypothetical protein
VNKLIVDKRYSSYNEIPAMTPEIVHYYLTALGSYWSGQGCVVELGCWLGATTRALLDGLERVGFNRPYHAYDSWRANDDQVSKAAAQGVRLKPNQDLTPLFLHNVGTKVHVHQGEIGETINDYSGEPIEICLFDAPKQDPLFTHCMDKLRPYFIPGVTVVGLLVYYFYREHPEKRDWASMANRFMAPVEYIEKHKYAFRKQAEWPEQSSCVFFRYLG